MIPSLVRICVVPCTAAGPALVPGYTAADFPLRSPIRPRMSRRLHQRFSGLLPRGEPVADEYMTENLFMELDRGVGPWMTSVGRPEMSLAGARTRRGRLNRRSGRPWKASKAGATGAATY